MKIFLLIQLFWITAVSVTLFPLKSKYALKVPDQQSLSTHPNQDSILRGKKYLEQTAFELPEFVRAQINCTNCHLQSGTKAFAGHWVGIVYAFPQYRDRSGKEDTLKDRINDCFERSLNGQRLPLDHPAMIDIVNYMSWLSQDITPPTFWQKVEVNFSGMPKLKVNLLPASDIGQRLYQSKCQHCHMPEGQGLVDLENKKIIFPPLAGPHAFNIGAGMARLHTASGFIYHHMPLGMDKSLTPEEATHVAHYITQLSRPDLVTKNQDWPKGNKPPDARY